ncbi:MerR family transcriptional regulator [Nocardioides litoris]|uniref:MerR family transcriptional regulator n=1 Tax=Nocardioides litoris TaxID=1926648 RepID=UPI001B866456|nr:MerR family transcriptional regulator [Nocardioides litoris]
MGAHDTAAVHIGEVAARTELSLRSLRHWEEVGLITPSARTEGGFRLYTEDDVQKILFVRRMKPLGFSLEEMKAVLADVEALAAGGDRGATNRLQAVLAETRERRARLARDVAWADEFLGLLGDRLAD